jgi:hypothetical protein
MEVNQQAFERPENMVYNDGMAGEGPSGMED